MNIIEKIEDIIGDVSPSYLIDIGHVRVNGPDIGLDIRAGTVFLDLENRAIVCLGDCKKLNYYGGFEYVKECHIMKVKMGNQEITIYLAESARVESCFRIYETKYLKELQENENSEIY